ncbi:MAG TPA: hypothetical protein VH092_21190 [Urbifossiella sp.]|nr:hypothetical protein [Urbifossiella sp.]
MTAHTAGSLSPDQAAELIRVMELQACWENLRDDPTAGGAHGPGLRERQRRYDAFRAGLAGYTARYRAGEIPELTLNSPERVGLWCRAVRAVCGRAGVGAEAPVHVVGKAYRLADRIATRLKVPVADRDGQTAGMENAIRGLDAIIAWCDGLGRNVAQPVGSDGRILPTVLPPVSAHAA